MSKRVSKIRSQLGITSATVLMTLAVGSNCLVAPIQASTVDDNNVRTSIAAEKETQTVTRKIIVADPHFEQPQVHVQTVEFEKEGNKWRPTTSNFLPPFFPVQYENYKLSQTAVKPLVVSPGESIPDVNITYRQVDLSHAVVQGNLSVVAEDTDGGKTIHINVSSKPGEWVDFPPAPAGYEYMCDHPDKIYISRNGVQYVYLPVKKLADHAQDKVETRRVTRKVVFKLPSGDQEVVQEAYAKRTVTTSANGKYRQVSPWQIDSLPVIDVPQVDGYSSSTDKVPSRQLTFADFDSDLQDVIVTYTPRGKAPSTSPESTPVEHNVDKGKAHEDKNSANESAASQTDGVMTSEMGNQTEDEHVQQTSHSTQTADNGSSTVGSQTEVVTEEAVQKKQNSSSATQTDEHVLTASGVQTDEEKTSNKDLQTSDTQTSDTTVKDDAVETDPVTGVTVDSQTESSHLTDTSSQTSNPGQETIGLQTDRQSVTTTDSQTDTTVGTDSGVQIEIKPANEDGITQTEEKQLVTTETQTTLIPVGKDEGGQTTAPLTSESTGMQTDQVTQLNSTTQTTSSNQPIMISTAQQTEKQVTTVASAGTGEGRQTSKLMAEVKDNASHGSNQGTLTDDLVTVPVNKNVQTGLANVNEQKANPDMANLDSNNNKDDRALADLFAQDQAARRSLEQEKLPQTSNKTDNTTTLVGMLLTVLAGFLSGRWIKAYYRRRSK